MSTLVADAPRTSEQLKAGLDDVAAAVAHAMGTSTAAQVRSALLVEIEPALLNLARSPAWESHDLTTALLLHLEDLRTEARADPDAADREWRVRGALQRIAAVLNAMTRQLQHDAIDNPETAAHFVATTLASAPDDEVAALLGVTPRMLSSYRQKTPPHVRKNRERMALVGQVVLELKGSMAPVSIVRWMGRGNDWLNGRSPRALIEEDPIGCREEIMALLRAGRGQSDRTPPGDF